jgi:hypothetical protein
MERKTSSRGNQMFKHEFLHGLHEACPLSIHPGGGMRCYTILYYTPTPLHIDFPSTHMYCTLC